MKTARSNFGLIVLPNGKVLAIGGNTNSNGVLSSTEIYDPGTGPTTDGWAFTNNGTINTTLSETKSILSPILLSNGMVVVAGGNIGSSVPSTAVELFDHTTQNWTRLTDLTYPRAQLFAFALPNGRFVLLGGKNTGPNGLTPMGVGSVPGAVEVYDTLKNDGQGATESTTNLFLTEGRINSSGGAAAGVLANGTILLAAGSLTSTAGSTSEIYDPATGTLTVGPAMTTGQGGGVLGVSLANGDLMLIGGDNKSDCFTQIYRP
jgi:hypothetical protein